MWQPRASFKVLAALELVISAGLGSCASPKANVPAPARGERPAAAETQRGLPAHPGRLLDLAGWKLTLPVATTRAGHPDEISPPRLCTLAEPPYFMLNESKDGVVFRAHVGGATTSGSRYPRSELREMTPGGAANASWSSVSGTHTMVIRQAITHLPRVKPHVVAGQIHDGRDEVVMVRLEGRRLFVEAGGKELAVLDGDYVLGRAFTITLVASGGRIRLLHNNVMKLNHAASVAGCYFKAGCYTQSNPGRGDAADDHGEVVVYQLEVTHR